MWALTNSWYYNTLLGSSHYKDNTEVQLCSKSSKWHISVYPASHFTFSPLITIQHFQWLNLLALKIYTEKYLIYAMNALVWLFWNQSKEKPCILHKPANYCILITAIFIPQSLLTIKSCSVTLWELTHYSKLSPE